MFEAAPSDDNTASAAASVTARLANTVGIVYHYRITRLEVVVLYDDDKPASPFKGIIFIRRYRHSAVTVAVGVSVTDTVRVGVLDNADSHISYGDTVYQASCGHHDRKIAGPYKQIINIVGVPVGDSPHIVTVANRAAAAAAYVSDRRRTGSQSTSEKKNKNDVTR